MKIKLGYIAIVETLSLKKQTANNSNEIQKITLGTYAKSNKV